MQNRKFHVVVSALLIAALLTTSLSAIALAAPMSAPSSQVTAATVTGTLTGGVFDKVWLGFAPTTPNTDVTVVATWDIDAPGSNGRHFYVLDENNLSAVVNGGSLQNNNIASSGPVFQGPGNQESATFRAGTGTYTVVVANDSANDATFTLSTAEGTFSDDSNKVVDPNATPGDTTPAADEAAGTPAESAPEAAAEVEASTEVTTTTTVTETTVTTETTETVAAEPAAVATAAPVAATTAITEVRAASMAGALPEQYDQHFLGLVPDTRDGEVSLLLSFDPQDSQELARRLNFWVLDAAGLQRFVDGTNASEVAIAAGNRTFTGDTNERVATFTAAGSGPYTVIVYNNSQVPATYNLTATGGILVDDSAQTTTAQNAAPVSATGATTATTATAPAATTTESTTTTTTTAPASTGSAGEPGGTHTVASGDTLAIIARDVYGDYTLYTKICAFNNISDCNRIEVGQVIQLPTQAQLDSGAVAATTPAAAAPAAAVATAAATPAATTATTGTTGTTTAATPAATAAATTAAALPTATSAAGGTTAAGDSIIAELEANGNFTILLQALDAAGLTSQLRGAGSFTLFAPTDTAFTDLGLADVNSLIRDTALVENLLLFHMADSKVSTSDVATGEELTTLQGSAVEFTVSGQTVKVQDSNIIVPDLSASNGVIQVIDKVMLPPQ